MTSRGRQRITIFDGLAAWLGKSTTKLLWRVMGSSSTTPATDTAPDDDDDDENTVTAETRDAVATEV